jgi:hypothetical protein
MIHAPLCAAHCCHATSAFPGIVRSVRLAARGRRPGARRLQQLGQLEPVHAAAIPLHTALGPGLVGAGHGIGGAHQRQGAVAAIKANWATFFNAKTPLSRRVALLQNGQALSGVIKSQLSGSGFASQVTSKVTAVTLTGTNQASVVYSIYLAGQPALANSQGVSVYQDGVWKVGLVSLCGLLKVENAGKTAGLPAACKG